VNARAKSLTVRAYLKAIATTNRPVILGPYRSELGFEHLYYIPFLHWALSSAGISKDRCLAVSRGGMGKLYPAASAVDLYDLRGVEAVRLENATDHRERGIQKQTTVTPWDRQVAADALARSWQDGQIDCTEADVARRRFHLLHPSWMYWLLDDYWEEKRGVRHVVEHCRFEELPVPVLPEGFGLPQKFLAVRFYERATFPLVPEVRGYVREMVANLAARRPVVLLSQSGHFDDHTDLPLAGANILRLPEVPPAQNFLLQAAVIARCNAFVGTYGGVAQWALRYRRPSLSFYTSFGQTAVAHWSLSRHLANTANLPFEVVDLKAWKLWQMALTPMLEQVAA